MHLHDDPELQVAKRRAAPAAADATAATAARAIADPSMADASGVMALQRLAGNASVSRMLAPEAEEVAEGQAAEGPAAQRSPVLDVVNSGSGRPLDDGVRAEMETRLGSDFSNVRVHDDAKASDSARSINAQAYTVGEDVVLRSDMPSPDTDAGKQTLAHELIHVDQQRAGPVAGTPVGGGLSLSDPGDQFEQAAEAHASAAMAAPLPDAVGAAAPTPAAQRQEDPEEEELAQGQFVQRQEDLEEEEMAQGRFVQRQEEPEEEEMPA